MNRGLLGVETDITISHLYHLYYRHHKFHSYRHGHQLIFVLCLREKANGRVDLGCRDQGRPGDLEGGLQSLGVQGFSGFGPVRLLSILWSGFRTQGCWVWIRLRSLGVR